jgi:hypothetical protein
MNLNGKNLFGVLKIIRDLKKSKKNTTLMEFSEYGME